MTRMTKKSVQDALTIQLQAKKADIAVFSSLIHDYIALWETKEKLIQDIKERGITYVETGSTGSQITKNNPSTKELVMVNKQMLTLLKELNLNTNNVISEVMEDSKL